MNEEVMNRIRATKQENLSYLDLSGLGLTQIPLEILEVPWIGAISLSRNQISDISILSQMQNLHKLALSDNLITDIAALTKMPKLRFIFLAGNKIKDISAIKGQTRLKKLVLANNEITKIPDLSEFSLLAYLDLSENPLEYIDEQRLKESLPKLKILKL